jgi:hypothetical protein
VFLVFFLCRIYSVSASQKHQRGATPESAVHEEELNDIQIRVQSSRSPPSEPTPDRLSRTSLNQSNVTAATASATGGTGAGGASLVSISKPNSTTSSTMTASVVVNLPASYPGSEVEPASPVSPSTSPDQQPEVRISSL